MHFLVVGGVAVNAHGYERLTVDLDLVVGLQPENIIRALHILQSIGYRPAIPVTPEQFADAPTREAWRLEKQMLVLKLWSDLHRRTPLDIFVYEPFDFECEYARASWEQISPTVKAPIVSYQTLLAMKKEAAREKDLLDIAALQKLDPHR
ncbi:MAG: hypothetical protein ABI992_13140 [Chthoniobacterales bacterium]